MSTRILLLEKDDDLYHALAMLLELAGAEVVRISELLDLTPQNTSSIHALIVDVYGMDNLKLLSAANILKECCVEQKCVLVRTGKISLVSKARFNRSLEDLDCFQLMALLSEFTDLPALISA